MVSDSGVVNLDQSLPGNSTLARAFNLFLGGPPPDPAKVHNASPVSYTDRAAKLPPFLLLYGTADHQVPIALVDRFADELRANNHPDLTYIKCTGLEHCPWWNEWQKNHKPAAQETDAQIARFFERILKNPKGPSQTSRQHGEHGTD